MRQVNQELGEIGGVFVSKQPSDTDMGAKAPRSLEGSGGPWRCVTDLDAVVSKEMSGSLFCQHGNQRLSSALQDHSAEGHLLRKGGERLGQHLSLGRQQNGAVSAGTLATGVGPLACCRIPLPVVRFEPNVGATGSSRRHNPFSLIITTPPPPPTSKFIKGSCP